MKCDLSKFHRGFSPAKNVNKDILRRLMEREIEASKRGSKEEVEGWSDIWRIAKTIDMGEFPWIGPCELVISLQENVEHLKWRMSKDYV